VKETEKYNGEGWGLLQVLDSMKPISKGQMPLKSLQTLQSLYSEEELKIDLRRESSLKVG